MKVTKKEIAECKGRIDSLGNMIIDLKGEIWSEMYGLVKKRVGQNVVTVDRYELRCRPELEVRTDPKGEFYPAEDFDDEVMYKWFETLFGPVEDVE
jgi:hypothetical protein